MIKQILLAGFLVLVAVSFSLPASAHPHPGLIAPDDHTHDTQYIPIDGIIGLEKSTILFHSAESNELPWGFVEGKIANHVAGHPVIIQIFNNGTPMRFAQVDVNSDGTYEYKFRVLDISDGEKTHIFGDFTVLIFKTVYLSDTNII